MGCMVVPILGALVLVLVTEVAFPLSRCWAGDCPYAWLEFASLCQQLQSS